MSAVYSATIIYTYSYIFSHTMQYHKLAEGGLRWASNPCTDATQPSKSETIIIVHITTLIIISNLYTLQQLFSSTVDIGGTV